MIAAGALVAMRLSMALVSKSLELDAGGKSKKLDSNFITTREFNSLELGAGAKSKKFGFQS